jgi:hypothetical protein
VGCEPACVWRVRVVRLECERLYVHPHAAAMAALSRHHLVTSSSSAYLLPRAACSGFVRRRYATSIRVSTTVRRSYGRRDGSYRYRAVPWLCVT